MKEHRAQHSAAGRPSKGAEWSLENAGMRRGLFSKWSTNDVENLPGSGLGDVIQLQNPESLRHTDLECLLTRGLSFR